MRMHGVECRLLSETGQHAVQWRAERCKELGLCGIGLINFCEPLPPATLEGAKNSCVFDTMPVHEDELWKQFLTEHLSSDNIATNAR